MHHLPPSNIVQVFIEFTHSFVAIELLTFCNNAKKSILFLKRALGIPYVYRIDFLLFVYVKTFRKKYIFVYERKLRRLLSPKDNAHIYTHKKQKSCETLLYTKR